MRIYVALAFLLLAILLLYSFFPKFNQPLTEEQAKAFLAQDVSSTGGEWRILKTSKTGETWEFEVLVVVNAHSPCPTAEKRFYKLPPVSFRPEPFINSCYERGKLLFREEAVMNSAIKLGLSDGYGCAFKADANWFEEKSYCPELDEASIASFASGLPASAWVAFWKTPGGETKFMALDEDNNVLKSQ